MTTVSGDSRLLAAAAAASAAKWRSLATENQVTPSKPVETGGGY